MKSFRLTLEYDGSRYSGWQEQKNARTVMGELRKAAEEFFAAPVELGGAGRTDAGVHALGQVAHLRTDSTRTPPPARILRELNERLPADIVVLEVEPAPAGFHARHDALTRTYAYQISRRKTAFTKRFVWWVRADLDVAQMGRAARMLVGRHNFTCFRATDAGRVDDSPIVVVENAEIEEDGDLILFRIEASHFLWRMVRRVAGLLVKIGMGEVAADRLPALLEGRCDPALDLAAWTAPASGLFLESVRYGKNRRDAWDNESRGRRKRLPAEPPAGTVRPPR